MNNDKIDWLLFLALEKEFTETINYAEICENNKKTYSIAYLKLLISICSSIEKLGKKYCKIIQPDASCKDIKSINDIIIEDNPKFPEIECKIPRYNLLKKPWEKWSVNETPEWWTAYNDVKHNNDNYEDATQDNVINALAALFCLNLYYYKEKSILNSIEPYPIFFNHDIVPEALIGIMRSDLPGKP